MNRVVLLLASAAVLIVVCVAALIYSEVTLPGSGAGSHDPGSPADQVTVAYVATTHAVLAGVALQQGYFLQEGLDVTPRVHSFGKSALEDMLAGNADFATVADPPIMTAAMEGEPIRVIATIQTSNKDNAIVTREGTGILSPRDLKGRRIGATFGTTSDFFMEAFLVANGIAVEEVEKIDLRPEQLRDGLMRGDLDAVSAFQPFVIQMQRELGDRAVSFYDKNIYTWTFNIVAKKDFVCNNPETVKKLLRALIKAEAFVKENTSESQKIISAISGMDIGLVSEIWSNLRFQVTLDQVLVLALEDETRWAIRRGIIANREMPNYLDFFYFKGLESVRPKAVRVLGRPPEN